MKRLIIMALGLAMSLGAAARGHSDTLRVMTYNLRFGELATMQQFGSYIAERNPDLVALQECDWATKRSRAVHQNGVKFINELAWYSGMFGVYGKSIDYRGGYYGIGALSRYPIMRTERVKLPWDGKTEQRVMLVNHIELPDGCTVVFVSVHTEVSSGELRMEQLKFIDKYFRKCPYPVLVCGDFNAEPSYPEIEMFVKRGWKNLTDRTLTYSSMNPTIKIDYIFCKGCNAELISTGVDVKSHLSDHFPIVSDIIITNK